EVAGFGGAAGSHRGRVEEQDDPAAAQVGQVHGDAVLVREGEVGGGGTGLERHDPSLRDAQEKVSSSRCSESSRAGPRSPSRPAATASAIAQSGASRRWVHPRGHSWATTARSEYAFRMLAGSTCPRPKERTPGVSMTQPRPAGLT